MGWLFRKRIKLMPDLTLNLGKRGASLTLGKREASVNVGLRGNACQYRDIGDRAFLQGTVQFAKQKQPRPQAYAFLSSGSYTSSFSPSDSGERLILVRLGFAAGFFGGLYYFGSVLE